MSLNYSVLMSVYRKEKPEYLREAMDSIWNQTVPPDDFVLVCDGQLNEKLDLLINHMHEIHQELQVIRLKNNVGLGNALNCGIKYCKNELIARMDSDDISCQDRCKKQIEVFERMPNISICSGRVDEFTISINHVNSSRILPENHEDIIEFAKKRNPFNHPCVMYKKTAVEQSGGYQDFYLLEDYYLWIRMLNKGYVGYNLQEPLLWMRAGSQMYKRRSGRRYLKSQFELFKYMRSIDFIDNRGFFVSVIQRSISSIVPNKVRQIGYRFFLRT